MGNNLKKKQPQNTLLLHQLYDHVTIPNCYSVQPVFSNHHIGKGGGQYGQVVTK